MGWGNLASPQELAGPLGGVAWLGWVSEGLKIAQSGSGGWAVPCCAVNACRHLRNQVNCFLDWVNTILF